MPADRSTVLCGNKTAAFQLVGMTRCFGHTFADVRNLPQIDIDGTKILVAHLSKGLPGHQWQHWSPETQMPSCASVLGKLYGIVIAQAPGFRPPVSE